MSQQLRRKERANEVLSYKTDVTWETRMISQVQVKPEQGQCVHCESRFTPRYVGDQVCGVCR